MRTQRQDRDHAIASVAKVIAGGVAVLLGVLIVRTLPDLVRYVKMERM
jgi:hypothetical protein